MSALTQPSVYRVLCVGVLILLLFHIFLSFAIADVARFIRVRVSSVESPSEEKVNLRYLNDSTSSRRSPFIKIALLCAILLLP